MNRLLIISGVFVLVSIVIIIKMAMIINDDDITLASAQSGTYTINVVEEYADIYDCNMSRLVNYSFKYNAVIIPNHISSIQIQPYLIDKDVYYKGIKGHMPFVCEVMEDAIHADINTLVFKSAVRNDINQLAPHIVGYTQDNVGVCGLEKSYNDFFNKNCTRNSVTFRVDALGNVLNGLEKRIDYSEKSDAGIITTLDKNIQKICEDVFEKQNVDCGSVVIIDVNSGEIRASVSYPDFDITNLSGYVDDKNSPFLNRSMSAYSVGSIFKLVTAATALEQGISSEFCYTCTGSINVNGQIFNCHKWGGHGEIDMNDAIVQSCNTYFIALSEYLDKDKYVDIASALGFGKEIVLCDDIISVPGNLQTVTEINVPAERANMSFGQGKLSATPVQICHMTATIANNGISNTPILVKGVVNNEGNIIYKKIDSGKRVLSYKSVKELKSFMVNTVKAENSLSTPDKTSAAGKTSTAQTGQYDSNGNEIYNCWFTGYFPSYNPKYAVTIMIEGGVSGNVTAGPIYKEISDSITEYEKSLRNK